MKSDKCVFVSVRFSEDKLNEHKLIWPECLSLSHTYTQNQEHNVGFVLWENSWGKEWEKGGGTVVMTTSMGSRWSARLTLILNKHTHTHSGGTTLYCRQETLRPASLSTGKKVVPHTSHYIRKGLPTCWRVAQREKRRERETEWGKENRGWS